MDVFRFITIAVAFVLSVILCKILIPILVKFKFGQQVRQEGNRDHLKKQGTPTMGGIAFLLAILIAGLAFCLIFKEDPAIYVPVLLMTFIYGVIGFLDDFLKIKKKQSEGLKAWQKLLLQFLATGGFAFYCCFSPKIGSTVVLPFTGGKTWDMGWLYIPFVFLAVLGTDNGTNFTDGLDGLLASVTVVVSLFLMVVSGKSSGAVSIISGAVAGALMGYLLFNSHPAKVFMGDTGSLGIGAYVASAALVTKNGWFILIFGLIYLIEVLSVILQVSYFKLTHGKRIFLMSPIHHHYEKKGYSETQIVTGFTIFTIFMCMVAYLAM